MIVLLAGLLALATYLVYDGLTRPAPGERPADEPTRPGRMGRLRRALIPAGVPALAFLGVSLASAFLLALPVGLLTGWPLLVAGAGAGGLLLPSWLIRRRAAAYAARRREALPELLEQLRASVQGGLDVGEALAVLASSGPPALRPDLALLRLDLRLVGLPEALRRAMDRWPDAYFRRAAEALILNDRLGGQHVGALLEELAASARAEARARAEGTARQAEMVLTARVVALLPIGVLVILRQLNLDYVEPYATPQGQLVLGVVGVLVLSGHVLMRRAARLPGEDHRWGGQA